MTRTLYGARVSLTSGLSVGIIGVVLLVPIGFVLRYLGARVNAFLIEAGHPLPDLPLLVIQSKGFPPGFWTTALGLAGVNGNRL